MYKIVIGTTSEYKVNAIKSAITYLDINFESINEKVSSEVSDQPMKAGETKLGSINRAKHALDLHKDFDLGIGVEFGYEPIGTKYHMVCWASIVTKEGKIFSEQSSTLELPKVFKEALEKNIDIDSILNETLKDIPANETGRKFLEMIKKRKVIYECASNVTLRYFFDKEFY